MNALITQNLSTLALAVQNKSASGRGSGKKIDLYGIKKLREKAGKLGSESWGQVFHCANFFTYH